MTALLVGLHLTQQVEDEGYAVQQVLLQRIAFLEAESVNDVKGLVEGLTHFGHESLIIVLGRHIEDARHSKQKCSHIGSRCDAQL